MGQRLTSKLALHVTFLLPIISSQCYLSEKDSTAANGNRQAFHEPQRLITFAKNKVLNLRINFCRFMQIWATNFPEFVMTRSFFSGLLFHSRSSPVPTSKPERDVRKEMAILPNKNASIPRGRSVKSNTIRPFVRIHPIRYVEQCSVVRKQRARISLYVDLVFLLSTTIH